MKRIVVCADGTWNARDQVDEKSRKRRPTNVTKVARAVLPRAKNGTDQVVFYNEGVGTNGGVDKYSGGAFGHGLEDNVRVLYRAIAYNYVPGDELYFFGFSRGAFTVRTLAGFMKWVGLLEKDDDFFVPEIYGLYEKGSRPGSPEWSKAFRRVRNTRPCPPINFIGAWDTVGALGAPGVLGQIFNKGKYEYHDIGLHPEILSAYQALAIDERRKAFAPSIWHRPAGWSGKLEQAWFPGVHSNVGGGYYPDGLANEALHWLIGKAEDLGLEFDNEYLWYFKPCFNSTLFDSMSAKYKLLGSHERRLGEHGDVVHQSAVDRLNHTPSRYDAANLKRYLSPATAGTAANTTRVARGTPCEELAASEAAARAHWKAGDESRERSGVI
jgi:uncharacterized protein (DUF2235 family)